jgi:hypothetical protein
VWLKRAFHQLASLRCHVRTDDKSWLIAIDSPCDTRDRLVDGWRDARRYDNKLQNGAPLQWARRANGDDVKTRKRQGYLPPLQQR